MLYITNNAILEDYWYTMFILKIVIDLPFLSKENKRFKLHTN